MSYMPVWGQLNLQEANTTTAELLGDFHDFISGWLVGIFILVTYCFLWVLNSSHLDVRTRVNHSLETIWTIIPGIILIPMGISSLSLLYLTEDLFIPALTIKVIAHQWFWEYEGYSPNGEAFSIERYIIRSPENDTTLFYTLDTDTRIAIPEHVRVLFLITSADVLHSWTIPALGVKSDAIPGRLNYQIVTALTRGVYYGQCREICGSNHSFMPISIEVLPLKDYLLNI
jgi:cytochrome c oxidase subunit 2